MKISLAKRNRGLIDVGAGLAMLVLLLAILFFGFLIYILIKIVPKPRKLPDESISMIQTETLPPQSPEVFQFTYKANAAVAALQSTSEPDIWMATIQRSTNLVDWTDLYSTNLTDNIDVLDQDPPYPQAFYRALVWKVR
jgi:hypothetical protein